MSHGMFSMQSLKHYNAKVMKLKIEKYIDTSVMSVIDCIDTEPSFYFQKAWPLSFDTCFKQSLEAKHDQCLIYLYCIDSDIYIYI